MKQIIILSSLALAACAGNTQTKSVSQPDSMAQDTVAVAPAEVRTEESKDEPTIIPEGFYMWAGTLKGSIPIQLWFKREGSLLYGTLVYTKTKSKTPIRLFGNYDGSSKHYYLHEYQKDGSISGYFVFDSFGQATTGKWHGLNNGLEFPAEIRQQQSLDIAIDSSLAMQDPTGEYSYSYGEESSSGSITITQAEAGKIGISGSAVTPAPASHIADIGDNIIPIEGSTARLVMSDDGKCTLKIQLYHDFLYIESENGEESCEFGANASISGFYIKVK